MMRVKDCIVSVVKGGNRVLRVLQVFRSWWIGTCVPVLVEVD